MKLGSGFLVGAGVVFLAPIILPVASSVFKSLTKATIKGSLIAYNKAKIATAETMEGLDDLTAEAKAEITQESKPEVAKKTETAKK